MENLNHHRATASRCAVLAVVIALLASCATTDTTTDAAPIDGNVLDAVMASGYTINSGDTLSAIASRAGISVTDIVAVNEWADGSNHLILPGDVIQLPGGTTVEPAASKPAKGSEQTASTTPSSTRPSSTRPSSTRPSSTTPASTTPSSTRPSSTRPSSTRPSSTTPSSGAETQPWNCELANFDESVVVGSSSLTLHEVGCAEGWAVGYYGEYDDAEGHAVLEPNGHVILKADGQRWIKQDPNTVCNGLSPVPGELRWLCVGG